MCNLEGVVLKRTIPIMKLKAVTKSTQQGNFDFILHVDGERDYRFNDKNRLEIIKSIRETYFKASNKNLPYYGVPGAIKQYMMTNEENKLAEFDLRELRPIDR